MSSISLSALSDTLKLRRKTLVTKQKGLFTGNSAKSSSETTLQAPSHDPKSFGPPGGVAEMLEEENMAWGKPSRSRRR